MNFEIIMLSKRSHTQKVIYFMKYEIVISSYQIHIHISYEISFIAYHQILHIIRNIQNWQVHRYRKHFKGCQCLEGKENGGVTNGYCISFRADKNVLELDSCDGCTVLLMC